MAKKKRKIYGKTTKQWDRLYKDYTNQLKYERNLFRLNKTEFKEAWIRRAKGETVSDLVRKTRSETEYSRYTRLYRKTARKGISLAKFISEPAFIQQRAEYDSLESFMEGQQFVSKKQAKNWVEHAKLLGLDLTELDALSQNEKHDIFWNTIDELGGWEAAFEYGA